MTVPLIGVGGGLDLADLEPFIVEPKCPDGVQAAQRDFGADGSVFETGLHCVLLWPVIDGAEDYQAQLAQINLHLFRRQLVTAYLPDFQWDWHVYSGYAIRPVSPNYRLFPADIRMVLRDLYQVS